MTPVEYVLGFLLLCLDFIWKLFNQREFWGVIGIVWTYLFIVAKFSEINENINYKFRESLLFKEWVFKELDEIKSAVFDDQDLTDRLNEIDRNLSNILEILDPTEENDPFLESIKGKTTKK